MQAQRTPAPGRRPWVAVAGWRPLLVAALTALAALSAPAQCLNEDAAEPRPAAPSGDATPADPGEPRLRLHRMVGDALARSQAVGAARLLAEAAEDDKTATEAARKPQLSVGAGLAAVSSKMDGASDTGGQARASITLSQLLFDSGRNAELADWRKQLAEAARLGTISTEEQVALQTVSLAIERSRYRLQAQIFQQYGRKMACLVEALETIVRADKGRASELVQARKSQQQAELQQQAAASALRQIETRLQRLVGDPLPSAEGMSSLLLVPPALDGVLADAANAAEITRLDAAANAADSLARSISAESRPSASWTFGGSKAFGTGATTSWQAGINVNVPLLSPATDPSAAAARKRAEAARLQRLDALESRRYRMMEVYEQATSAFDRARRAIDIVRDSDRVRNFTLQQWQQLGKRSLFDVMSAEGDHYGLRVAYVNALHDGQQSTALLRSLGRGITDWLQ